MIETTHIGAGRWGLSRIFIRADGSYTTYASEQKLADHIAHHYPPMNGGAYVIDVCVVRLQGNITQPSDGNTVLLPRSLQAIGDIELGELTIPQRNALRTVLTNWLTAYQYVDYRGQTVHVPAFDPTAYTATSTLKEVFRDVRRYIQNSTSRPRTDPPPADHNTEYTDDFSTDATGWTDMDGFGDWTHDSTNDEADITINGGPTNNFRFDTAPGDMEQEAQITAIQGASSTYCTGPIVRCHNSTTEDLYMLHFDATNYRFDRLNGGSRTTISNGALARAAGGDFYTIRLAASGANGANVLLEGWLNDTNSTTKPSDPGWIGDTGTPDCSYTDTDANRLDDSSVHLYGGMGHQYESSDYDTRCDHFKVQTISDRDGGSTILPLFNAYCG